MLDFAVIGLNLLITRVIRVVFTAVFTALLMAVMAVLPNGLSSVMSASSGVLGAAGIVLRYVRGGRFT